MFSVRTVLLLIVCWLATPWVFADWLIRETDATVAAKAQAQGLTLVHRYRHFPWAVYRAQAGSRVALAATPTDARRMLESNGLQAIEPQPVFLAATPNDSQFAAQDAFASPAADASITLLAAWDIITAATIPVIAVIDSGVDQTHPDLVNNLWVNTAEAQGTAGVDDDGNGYIDDLYGWNTIDGDANLSDDLGHGTGVCGIIGAEGNNGLGISGVCWRARIMALKAFSSTTSDIQNVLNAFDYALDHSEVRIINASWVMSAENEALHDAIKSALAQGVVVVNAAGNGSDNIHGNNLADVPAYPASWTDANIVAVAAIDAQGARAEFSNYGTNVAVAAPGASLLSTQPVSDYGYVSGTSFAAPVVSGALALLLAREQALTPAQMRQRLIDTSRVTSPLAGVPLGGGLLNVTALLRGQPAAVSGPGWDLYQ